MNQDTIPEQENLFEDHIQYTPATNGQRFLNWLIDNLLMRFGLSYLTGTAVGYLINNFFPAYAMHIVSEKNPWDLILLGYAIGIFNYLIYYTICEKAFRGYTLGKLFTGTRAIRDNGEELTFKDALLRSLSRLVPFEVLSGFGDRPWHDSWTKTQVIKVR
jgi:uncharacterized RDD family membrane protein YckC